MIGRTARILAIALLVVACDDDPPPEMDAGPEPTDAGPGDAGAPPTCWEGPREVQAVAEPAELMPSDYWLFARVAQGTPDPFYAAFVRGELETPVADDTWAFEPLFEPGVLGQPSSGTLWAAGSVEVAEGQHVFTRAARLNAFGNAYGVQPGDVYGAGWSRVPFVTEPGVNDIFVRMTGGRNLAELHLFSTPDEVYLNFEDATRPQLRQGEMDEQWLGLPLLELDGHPLRDVTARVVASDDFEATEVTHTSLPGGAIGQLAFRLVPTRPWAAPGMVTVTVQVESECLGAIYEATTELEILAPEDTFRRTFRSGIDDSVQFYGVRPPVPFDADRDYALVLSLHGAAVNARGQANAYGPKDWAYIIAPTNRRPFGFDWEAWGRLDGIEVLEDAQATWRFDPTQTYLTGHSMGGHGTWQFGVLFPGRFALVGPSAGWSSFYSYGGSARPMGAFARAAASSDTNNYVDNLERRDVYIIHGDADNNVPVREARDMRTLVEPIAANLGYHEQPGAGHWWDDDPDTPGAACVDWAPMFTRMSEVRLDPNELEFSFRTPSPAVSPEHSFVSIRSIDSADEDATVTSALDGMDGLTITTSNVRSMVLDGDVLMAASITRLSVDGADVPVAAGALEVGPQDGKTPEQHGPFAQAMHRPWCWVYPDDSPAARFHVGYLASFWQIIGNGASCAVPLSEVDDALRAERNLVFVGVPSADTGASGLPFSWDASAINTSGARTNSAMAFVYPRDGHLDAYLFATEGREAALYQLIPFSSRFSLPDYLVFGTEGATDIGFFGPDWSYSP